MTVIDEKILIEKVQSGNEEAFRELFYLYKDIIFRICYRYSENSSESEELTQEIFIKIFESIHTFNFESKFSTWLYKVSCNHCLNYIRKKKRVRFFSLDMFFGEDEKDQKLDVADSSPNIEQVLEKKDEYKLLNDALNSLPESQKTAIILSKFEDLSYSEIAEIMNCTKSAVESLLFRAKQNLSRKLSKYFE